MPLFINHQIDEVARRFVRNAKAGLKTVAFRVHPSEVHIREHGILVKIGRNQVFKHLLADVLSEKTGLPLIHANVYDIVVVNVVDGYPFVRETRLGDSHA